MNGFFGVWQASYVDDEYIMYLKFSYYYLQRKRKLSFNEGIEASTWDGFSLNYHEIYSCVCFFDHSNFFLHVVCLRECCTVGFKYGLASSLQRFQATVQYQWVLKASELSVYLHCSGNHCSGLCDSHIYL